MAMRQTWQRDPVAMLAEVSPGVMEVPGGRVEHASFGEGPAVVALHGALGGYDQGLILALTVGAPGYRYVSVSRPGYLKTPMSSGSSPEAEADLVAHVLDRLAIPDAVVMAVSGGGPGAIHFALRHADRCRGLILISTVSGVMLENVPLAFRIMKRLARIPAVGRLMERQVRRDPARAAGRSIADPALRRRTLADPHAGPLLRALVLSTADRMPSRLDGTERDIRVTRTREYPLEALAVPVLAVHGTADDAAPFAHAERLVQRAPRAELLALEGGAHGAIFTHHREVRPRVARFFAETLVVPGSAPAAPAG
jgi:pimeloyl-ACP methyl ester carboxylesterase